MFQQGHRERDLPCIVTVLNRPKMLLRMLGLSHLGVYIKRSPSYSTVAFRH